MVAVILSWYVCMVRPTDADYTAKYRCGRYRDLQMRTIPRPTDTDYTTTYRCGLYHDLQIRKMSVKVEIITNVQTAFRCLFYLAFIGYPKCHKKQVCHKVQKKVPEKKCHQIPQKKCRKVPEHFYEQVSLLIL